MMTNHHNQDRRNLAFRQSLFRSLFPNFWSALLGRVAHFFCLRRYVYQLLKMPFYKLYKFYILKYSALHFLRCSTFFYKVLQTALRNTDFLHFSINSTLFLFCRKYIILIYRHLRFADVCRTCSGVTMVLMRKKFFFLCETGLLSGWDTWSIFIFRETIFFWAFPYGSGYAGVSVLDDLPRCRFPLVVCNVAEHLTPLRALTIPNAFFRLSLLIGYSAARQTIIRYNCYILLPWIFRAVVTCKVCVSELLRLISHCKGKTRPLRTGKPMQGQAVPVWRKNLPFMAALHYKRVFFRPKPCISAVATFIKQWKTTQLENNFVRK